MEKINKKKKFNNNGYLIINKFYDLDTVDSTYTEINKGQNKVKNFFKNAKDSSNNYGFAYEKTGIKYLKSPELFFPGIYNFITKKLFNIISELLDDKVFIKGIELHQKFPGATETPPHQDNFYFCLKKAKSVTAYIPLNLQNKSNGGLAVYPSSHKDDFPHYQSNTIGFSSGIKIENLNSYNALNYSLNPGDLSIHHCNIVHFAPPNSSKIPRISLAIRFQSQNDYIDKNKENTYKAFLKKSKRI